MKFYPIGEESLGVRSMSLYIETGEAGLLLDPGASLAPRRYGLPPHPREMDAIEAFRRRLYSYVKIADVLFISHYHRDHFTPTYRGIYMGTGPNDYRTVYTGKVIFAKDYNTANPSQKVRGIQLFKRIKDLASRVELVDGKEVKLGGVKLRFSKPLPHGDVGSKTGFVIGVSVEEKGERLLYLPDVQGPLTEEAVNFVMSESPNALFIGGFPYYLVDYAFSQEQLERSRALLGKIVEGSGAELIVIGHHLLRSLNWRDALPEGAKLKVYSELLGQEANLLEARRKELYEKEPPPREHYDRFRGEPTGEE